MVARTVVPAVWCYPISYAIAMLAGLDGDFLLADSRVLYDT